MSSLLHPEVSDLKLTKQIAFLFSGKKKLYLSNSRLTLCIGRVKAEADPAPNFHMLWRVFPYMFTQVRTRVKKYPKIDHEQSDQIAVFVENVIFFVFGNALIVHYQFKRRTFRHMNPAEKDVRKLFST